jgi:hypothetical protein
VHDGPSPLLVYPWDRTEAALRELAALDESDERSASIAKRGTDRPMFDDMTEEHDGFEFSDDSSDRELLFAIWTRNEIGDLPADEAWAILFERYPSEHRFLLLHAYEAGPDVGTSDDFAKMAMSILEGSERLEPRVRDLVITAWSSLFDEDSPKKVSPRVDAVLQRVRLSAKQPPSEEVVEDAYAHLNRFAAEVVKEMHDKTTGTVRSPRDRMGPRNRSWTTPPW